MGDESANSKIIDLCEGSEDDKSLKDKQKEFSMADKKTERMSETVRKTIIGVVIVVLLAVSWVGAQQTAQTAVQWGNFEAPYFTTWYGTCWMVLCFPGYAIFVIISERDKAKILHAFKESTHIFGPQSVTMAQFFKIIWSLNAIWLAVNSLYVFGLKFIYATDASAIMASNVAFVYMLSLCLLKEKLYAIRIIASFLCISGVVLFGYAKGFQGSEHLLQGVLMIIASAFGAAVYKVVFKKVVGNASLGQVSLFLTLLGLSNTLLMWTVSVCLYVAEVEKFGWSDIPWQAVNLSALLSLIFNFLVNFGIAYTYPLFISIAMMIGIPLNAGVDVIFRHGTFSAIRLVAAVLVFSGFAIMLFPDSWNDPIHSILQCKTENPEGKEEEMIKLKTNRDEEEKATQGSSSPEKSPLFVTEEIA
uniref:putative thiamine transporter SLC35F3 n=1 Tax=Styela clava TaxID=7725 RepID=UPI001939A3C5|nr:putative thiamine transporter SLC35F3 [Styela clava]